MTNRDLIDETNSIILNLKDDLISSRHFLKQKCDKIDALPDSEFEESQEDLHDLQVAQNRCEIIIEACEQ